MVWSIRKPLVFFRENHGLRQVALNEVLMNLDKIDADNAKGIGLESGRHRTSFIGGFLGLGSDGSELFDQGSEAVRALGGISQQKALELINLCMDRPADSNVLGYLAKGERLASSSALDCSLEGDRELADLAAKVLSNSGLSYVAIHPDYSKAMAMAALDSLDKVADRIGQLTGLGSGCLGAGERSLSIGFNAERFGMGCFIVGANAIRISALDSRMPKEIAVKSCRPGTICGHALAHEWFHSFDDHLGEALEKDGMATREAPDFKPVQKLLEACLGNRFGSAVENIKSGYIHETLENSQTRSLLSEEGVELFDSIWMAGYESFIKAVGPAEEHKAMRELAVAYEVSGTKVSVEAGEVLERDLRAHKRELEAAFGVSDLVHWGRERDRKARIMRASAPEPYWADEGEIAARCFEKMFAENSADLDLLKVSNFESSIFPQGQEFAAALLALRLFFAEAGHGLCGLPNADPFYKTREKPRALPRNPGARR